MLKVSSLNLRVIWMLISLLFFFSSRRRHTRCSRDWSSDVCSSDLKKITVHEFEITGVQGSTAHFRVRSSAGTYVRSLAHDLGGSIGIPAHLKELRRTDRKSVV